MPEFDLVIFGATGFTGKLVCDYVAKNAPVSLKWAIAGRSLESLKKVKLDYVDPNNTFWTEGGVGILCADVKDQASIDAMVSKTRVLIDMAGPYALYGEPVVDACVRFGVDYVDITGEYHFVRRMIDKFQTTAHQKKIALVSFCGFDSIPLDLNAFMVSKAAQDRFKEPVKSIKTTMFDGQGGFSGGTIASGLAISKLPGNEQKAMQDPFYLVPRDRIRAQAPVLPFYRRFFSLLPYYDNDFKKWQSSFIMEHINKRVILRSVAYQPDTYAEDFTYQETQSTPNFFAAMIISIAVPISAMIFRSKILCYLLSFVLPKPGTGPSEKTMKEGFFEIRTVATTTSGKQLKSRVFAAGDPGYTETAKMVSESAFCLLFDRAKLPCVKAKRFGFLTPSLAFGNVLIERLRLADQVWEVTE